MPSKTEEEIPAGLLCKACKPACPGRDAKNGGHQASAYHIRTRCIPRTVLRDLVPDAEVPGASMLPESSMVLQGD
jgi:hypothetical protein